jgi:hypothetical protein
MAFEAGLFEERLDIFREIYRARYGGWQFGYVHIRSGAKRDRERGQQQNPPNSTDTHISLKRRLHFTIIQR